MGKRGLKPGWYPDPDVPARHRWWNGSAWTQWLSSTREQTFPPPGGDEVVPVPTTRDKIGRGLWIAAGVIALAMAVMAGIGMVVNQRRDAAAPEVAWVSSAPPAPTETPLGYGDIRMTNTNRIVIGSYAEVQGPREWRQSNDGQSTDLPGFFDPMVTLRHMSKVEEGSYNAIFLVGTPEQDVMPSNVRAVSEGSAAAMVKQTYGQKSGKDTQFKLRQSKSHPGLGPGLVAWRVTADFVNPDLGAPNNFVIDLTWFQTSPGQWIVVGALAAGSVQKKVLPEVEAAVKTVKLSKR